jgi:glucuronoarabinoxylan endo-1,4-beta-xylanase
MAPDAITWAYNIHMFLTEVSGSAWFYWNLAAETVNGPTACNDGLTDQSNQPTKRFYAIGNWSRFVRSGWVEIAATANPQSGVYVTAFMNQSNGAFAIVAINQNTSSIQQIFTLSGLSANSLTPWITSSSLNLASQSSVSVLGSNFTYTLPAQSITTFVSGGGSSPAFSSRPAH